MDNSSKNDASEMPGRIFLNDEDCKEVREGGYDNMPCVFDSYHDGDHTAYIRADIAAAQITLDGDVREQLAKHAHDVWSGWMRYMFSKCKTAHFKGPIPEGDTDIEMIPDELVKRWTRQASTLYEDLPEDEKESDREIADKILSIIEKG